MYQAKRRGGARHQILDLREPERVATGSTWAGTCTAPLPGASCRHDYQPIVRTVDGRMIGVEALMRWDAPGPGAGGAD